MFQKLSASPVSPANRSKGRFTIKRLRVAVLVGGSLLIATIGIFLGVGQWKLFRQLKDLPRRMGADIQETANGIDYTQSSRGRTIFKIHAAKAVQMKSDGRMLLHDVRIDLYDENGKPADTITGREFEYDRNAGIARAAGAVEITLLRPDAAAARNALETGPTKSERVEKAQKRDPSQDKQILVKTSGLTFYQKTGVATTNQQVDFSLQQGSGTSLGATYDSSKGQLILDRNVALQIDRNNGPVTVQAAHAEFERTLYLCNLVQARAQYTGGNITTGNALIHLREDGSVLRLDGSNGVDLQTDKGSHVTAPQGYVDFDEQNHLQHGLLQGGSVLDMTQDSPTSTARHVHGTAPTARLLFNGDGQLRQAHLERGVFFNSQQQIVNAKGVPVSINRNWSSKFADLTFVDALEIKNAAARTKSGNSKLNNSSPQVEPKTIHGWGGVVITSDTAISAQNARATSSSGNTNHSRLAADDMVAELAPGGIISTLDGNGHASYDEVTTTGVHQATSSDKLTVHFAQVQPGQSRPSSNTGEAVSRSGTINAGSEITSMIETGNVVLTQEPAARLAGSEQAHNQTGNPAGDHAAPPSPLRATAAKADYDGKSQFLHLTGAPRVRDGALDMTANLIEFSRSSGDAFAHGDVKASWENTKSPYSSQPGAEPSGEGHLYGGGRTVPGSSLLSGSSTLSAANGPIHAVASEAEMHQSTQEVIFRRQDKSGVSTLNPDSHSPGEPRLWQAANSVSAPVIVLNRQKETLDACANGPAEPVRTVLTGQGGGYRTSSPSRRRDSGITNAKLRTSNSANSSPANSDKTVIRIRSGDLHYSEGQRIALFHAGSVGSVTSENSTSDGQAEVVSQELEVKLFPLGIRTYSPASKPATSIPSASANHADSANSAPGHSNDHSNIDQLIASGQVQVDWPYRHGTGEKLVYSSEADTYTLTGTSTSPPHITDQQRGTVTGDALIFHAGDDSFTVEGDGHKTVTDTVTPKKSKQF